MTSSRNGVLRLSMSSFATHSYPRRSTDLACPLLKSALGTLSLATIALLMAVATPKPAPAQAPTLEPVDDCEQDLMTTYERWAGYHALPGRDLVAESTLCSALEENGFQVSGIARGFTNNLIALRHRNGAKVLMNVYLYGDDIGIDGKIKTKISGVSAIANPETGEEIRIGDYADSVLVTAKDATEMGPSAGMSAIKALIGTSVFDYSIVSLDFENDIDGLSQKEARAAFLAAARRIQPRFAGTGDMIYDYASNGFPDGTTGLWLETLSIQSCSAVEDDPDMLSCDVHFETGRSYALNMANQAFVDTISPLFDLNGRIERINDRSSYSDGEVFFVRRDDGFWDAALTREVISGIGLDRAPSRDKTIEFEPVPESRRCVGVEIHSLSFQALAGCL